MTKQDIRRALAKAGETQAFITATQLAECMGIKTANYVKKAFLSGLECVDGKYYFIPDVAAELISRRKIEEDGE